MKNPTNMSKDEFISYLAKHGIGETKQSGSEVSFPCPFGVCDDDHCGNEEFHCGFNCNNCTYHCFKCGANGNFITLLKHFGDYEEYSAKQKTVQVSTGNSGKSLLGTMVRKIHKNTHESESVRNYFNGRGINNDSIDKFVLGVGQFDKYRGFMIPIFDRDGNIAYVKIRRTPADESAETIAKTMGQKAPIPKYVVYPAGAKVLLVGEDQLAKSTSSDALICEGELDRIIAIQEDVKIPVVCGGGGAQTFKNEWIDSLKNMRNIYLCMDVDEVGRNSAEKLARRLSERIPTASIYLISLPFEDNSHADLTDYFVEKRGTANELFSKYAKFYCGTKPIDASQFKELTIDDIANVLNSTIKHEPRGKQILPTARRERLWQNYPNSILLQ